MIIFLEPKLGLQQYPYHFIILLGDGSSWIDGTYCARSDGEETEIFYKDFTDLKDLETAKKVCAAGCDANEACKYAEIIWYEDAEYKQCFLLTKDECEKKDDISFIYLYKKQ